MYVLSRSLRGLGILAGLSRILYFSSHKAVIHVFARATIWTQLNWGTIYFSKLSGCWQHSVPSRLLNRGAPFLAVCSPMASISFLPCEPSPNGHLIPQSQKDGGYNLYNCNHLRVITYISLLLYSIGWNGGPQPFWY